MALLDRDGSDAELWNRGASYLRFTFDGAPGAEPVISTPSPDIVQVSVDPCGLPEQLRIATLIRPSGSTRPA